MADLNPTVMTDDTAIITVGDDFAPVDGHAANGAVPVLVEGDTDADELPTHAIANADGSVTLPLKRPVTLQYRRASTGSVTEEVFEELRFHRLTGADLRALAATNKDAVAPLLFARSARMSAAKMNLIYDRMDGADVNFAQRAVASFL